METNIKEELVKSQIKLERELLSNPLVVEYFKTNFGENSINIILAAMEEMTDDAIAARCKTKVAEVRATLNKLYNYRMAQYKRIKDRDTGWFSYLWKIDVSNILDIINEQTSSRIEELSNNIERMNTEFIYYCPQCSKTNVIHFDLAAEMSFRCPNCGNKLVEKERTEVAKYESELKELKDKHLSLLEDIKKFEEAKRQEELRIKELQLKMQESTEIIELSDTKKHSKEKGRNIIRGKTPRLKLKVSKAKRAAKKVKKSVKRSAHAKLGKSKNSKSFRAKARYSKAKRTKK